MDTLQSKKLQFLEPIIDNSNWSLYEAGRKLEALKFSNGKTQEDIVQEITSLIKSGCKTIFLQGVCGSGKSAIALHLSRALGKISIVVPIKSLQMQYERDYTEKKYVLKKNQQRLKIAMITGRDNHDSVIQPGVTCANPFLPDTITITEKNRDQIINYYENNPMIKNKQSPELKKLRRISIAPTNPHWSPIIPAEFELTQLTDAKKKRYTGIMGREFIFHHRKEGCTYYDQYQAYIDADVIIFNAAKYKLEMAIGRKPETVVDIIDEADEFLDSFSTQDSLDLTRLAFALASLIPEFEEARIVRDEIIKLISLEEKNKAVLGIDEQQIFHVDETNICKIMKLLLNSPALQAEILLDELNYANHALEVATTFSDLLKETYVTYHKEEKELFAHVVTTDLSKRFAELSNKTKALVLMSGTLHSEEVLRHIFGIKDFKIIQAENVPQGIVELQRTGKEFDCKYQNFQSGKHDKEEYLRSLDACLQSAKKPTLVQVQAFDDLPAQEEIIHFGLKNLMPGEQLKSLQLDDKSGRLISMFKSKMQEVLFTTKCSRGVDFPGDMCNSVVFTKYPHPNVRNIFWRILKKIHPDYYWEFYKDKAHREFLQRIYRAVRSKDDHVYILSPDSRVLEAVRNWQKEIQKNII